MFMFTLSPISYNPHKLIFLPIVIYTVKLSASFNLLVNLLQISELHSKCNSLIFCQPCLIWHDLLHILCIPGYSLKNIYQRQINVNLLYQREELTKTFILFYCLTSVEMVEVVSLLDAIFIILKLSHFLWVHPYGSRFIILLLRSQLL